MANLFWVAGSVAYDGVTNTLATSSGGTATVAVINTADTVTFDNLSPAAAAVTTSAAISCTNLILNTGFTGSLTMSNAQTVSTTLTVTQGSLNTNGQTCSWGALSSSNTNTRAIHITNSSVTITGTSGWNSQISTGLTITATGSTITFTGASANGNFGTGTNALNNVVFSGSGAQVLSQAAGTSFVNLTRTGTAVKTDSFTAFGNFTISGTLTLTGNSVTNRLLVSTTVYGTHIILTAAAVSITNVDFQDIQGAGAASPFTGTSLGDALGNSGITFDSPLSLYGVNTSDNANWSTALWSTSSGGSSGARVPLPQDSVFLDSNSGTHVYTIDMPRFGGNIDCTGFTGTLTSATVTLNVSFYGNLTISSGMSWTSGGSSYLVSGRGSQTLNLDSKPPANSFQIIASGGSYTLLSNYAVAVAGSGFFTLVAGTFNANGFNVTVGTFSVSGTYTKALLMSSGTWTLTATGTIWSASNTTVTANTSTIVISDTSTTAKTFAGGGSTYNQLTVTGGSGTTVAITGANTFNGGVTVTNPDTVLTFPSSITTTVSSFNATGQNNGYLYLPGLAANYASTPNSSALQITSDIEIMVRVALANWTPGANEMLASKLDTSGQFAYDFYMTSANWLSFRVSLNGTTVLTTSASVATGFTNGTTNWLRVTRVASTGVVTYYTAADSSTIPSSWTQLGTTQSTTSGSIFAGTDDFEMGANNGGAASFLVGNIYRVIVNNGIGGTTELDANFTTKPFGANSFTESSSNAATVTINGAQAQAGDGRILIESSTPGTQATIAMGAPGFTKQTGIFPTSVYQTSGYLIQVVTRTLVSTYKTAGSLIESVARALISIYSSSGVLTYGENFFSTLTSTYSTTGTLLKRSARSLNSTYKSTGALAKRSLSRLLSGTYKSSGVLTSIFIHNFQVLLTSVYSSSGKLVKSTSRILTSTYKSSGFFKGFIAPIWNFIVANVSSNATIDDVDSSSTSQTPVGENDNENISSTNTDIDMDG